MFAIGLGIALLGLAISLASARPPLRYPFLVLDAWRVLLRKPKTSSPREVAHLLPKAIMLLRSFPADTMSVENVDMEFGHDRVFFTATLEDTIRLFAHQNRLSLIKLGGETRSEGA